MKTSELFKILERNLTHPTPRDCEVVVKTSRPSIGYCSSSPVTHAHYGIDWDSNSFILSTDKDLVEKPDSMEIYDMAADLIYGMAKEAYHMKRPGWSFREALRIFEKKNPDWKEKYPNLMKR